VVVVVEVLVVALLAVAEVLVALRAVMALAVQVALAVVLDLQVLILQVLEALAVALVAVAVHCFLPQNLLLHLVAVGEVEFYQVPAVLRAGLVVQVGLQTLMVILAPVAVVAVVAGVHQEARDLLVEVKPAVEQLHLMVIRLLGLLEILHVFMELYHDYYNGFYNCKRSVWRRT